MEKQIAHAYPTPVGRFKVPGAEAVNRELRRVILEKEKTEPSDNYANVGGWHSRSDLLEWPCPEVRVLSGWIGEALGCMAAAVAEKKTYRGQFAVVAWANVARKGHYHRIHNHPSSAWSGVEWP